jgi:putative inorganic carbon (HCO3(-)) transporter
MPGAETGFNPNQVSGALIMFIPVQASLLWETAFTGGAPRGRQIVLAVGAALMLTITGMVVVIAQSRAAWVALVIGLAGLCLVEFRRARLPIAVLLFAGAAALAILWPLGVGDRLVQQAWTVSPGETSWLARVELWSRGLWTTADYPLTGTGMNIFRLMAWRSFPPLHFEFGKDVGHAHQAYIQVALDLGLPGLVSYLALLFGAIGSGWLGYRRTTDRFARHIVLASTVGVAIHAMWGFADAVALGAKQSFLWWSILALVAICVIQIRRFGLQDRAQEPQPALGGKGVGR